MFDKPFPFLDSDVYKWLEAAGWELGRAPDAADPGDGRRGDRARGGGPAPRRLPQHVRPGRRPPAASTATCSGATSCTASAISSRRPSPGTARSATTVSSSSPSAPCLRRAGARARRPRRDRRPPRDRDGARRAVPGHRRAALPRARDVVDRPPRPRAARRWPVRARLLAGPPAGPRGADGGRPRGAPAVPRLRRRRRRGRDSATTRCSTRSTAAGGTWSRRRRTSPAGSAAATRTRRSATRSSCRRTGPTPRRAPRSRRRCSPGGCCSRPATRPTPTSSSAPSTTGSCRALSLDGTAFFYVNPLQRRTHRTWTAPGDGERAPWYACACCPPNLMRLIGSWPQLLATETAGGGVHVHQYASAEVAGGRPAARRLTTDYPWDGARQGRRSSRRRTARGTWRSGFPRGAPRRRCVTARTARAALRPAAGTGPRSSPPGSGGRVTRSSSGWTSCRASRARIRASTRSAAASRSSAGRSSTRSSPPTCRQASSSRTSRSPDGAAPRDAAGPAIAPSIVGLTVDGDRRRDADPARARSRTSPGRNRGVGGMRVWIPTSAGS